MNPFEDFLKAVRNSMAEKAAEQVILPADMLNPAMTLSAKFYAGVPTESLHEYLQSALKQEDYDLCCLIRAELDRREAGH